MVKNIVILIFNYIIFTIFNKKILKVINEEQIPINEFGLVASLPKAFYNAKKWDKAAEVERDLADVSDTLVHKVKDVILTLR